MKCLLCKVQADNALCRDCEPKVPRRMVDELFVRAQSYWLTRLAVVAWHKINQGETPSPEERRALEARL